MDDLENGMVALGAREWERLNAETPADRATPDDFDMFAWDDCRVAEVMIRAFSLEDGDIQEDVAKMIFSGLPADFTHGMIREWMQDTKVQDAYNDWMEGR